MKVVCHKIYRHSGACTCGGRLVGNARVSRNTLRIDPSRTLGIQRRFIAELRARMRALKAKIWRWLVMEDELGMGKHAVVKNKLVKNAGQYKFSTDPQKQKLFDQWLQDQIDQGLLSTDANGSNNWTAQYIFSAYKQGIARAYDQVKGGGPKAGQDALEYKGGKAQFLEDSFGQPERIDSVEILATRAYNELDGVTDTMGQQMNRILADGLVNGEGPYAIAQEMNESIDGLTEGRALLIARTETAYAQAEGQLAGFEDLGVAQVGLLAEVLTAGDDRVCEECQDLADGGPYDMEKAHGMIPAHPRCRCAFSPVLIE